jgi:hypothetical protein
MGSNIQNPYEPAEVSRPDYVADNHAALRLYFFAVNFAFAIFFVVICLVGIIAPESFASIVGGITGVVPVSVYAICEWVFWYRKRSSLERPLGCLNLGCGTFILFVVLSAIGEFLVDESPIDSRGIRFILEFTVVGSLAICHLAFCGFMRWRWNGSNDANKVTIDTESSR